MDGHLTDYLDVLSMTTVASNLQPHVPESAI
jgi:hypothetical protein